jgi:hypothetical protein
MPAPATASYRLADYQLDGRLEPLLRHYRGAQVGYEAIARLLYAEAGVEVSGETLRRWGRELGIEDDAVPAGQPPDGEAA